jgi:hypothetical protein
VAETYANKNRNILRAIFFACYEYLLVAAPIFLYVILEAISSGEPKRLAFSPEWSIATIFLSYQGIALYRLDLTKTGRELSEVTVNILAFLSLIVIISSSINVYMSLSHESIAAIVVRIVLFCGASISFLIFVAGAKLALITKEVA